MTNDIPATPRLIEGWWMSGGGDGTMFHKVRAIPRKPQLVKTLCGRTIWEEGAVRTESDVADSACRRCLRSLLK